MGMGGSGSKDCETGMGFTRTVDLHVLRTGVEAGKLLLTFGLGTAGGFLVVTFRSKADVPSFLVLLSLFPPFCCGKGLGFGEATFCRGNGVCLSELTGEMLRLAGEGVLPVPFARKLEVLLGDNYTLCFLWPWNLLYIQLLFYVYQRSDYPLNLRIAFPFIAVWVNL